MRKALARKIAPSRELRLPVEFDKLPQQTDFVYDWETRLRAYGGGLNNGKTTGGSAIVYWCSVMFPQNRGLIARWDGKELRQTTIAQFLSLVPPETIETHNSQLGLIRFKREFGGSEILYSDLKETRYLKNMDLGWFWIDQAEEIDEERFTLLLSRLRKQTPLYDEAGNQWATAPTYGILTFNPEGSDHFLYKFFHPNSKDKLKDAKLYMASTYDALAVGIASQEYVDTMLSVFPEQARKRYLDGAWDIFEGRVLPAFDPTVHGLDTFAIQPWHKLYESIDHGSVNPTAVGWWIWTEPCAFCGQPTRVLVDEHYEGGGKGVAYHAAIVKTKRSQLPVKAEVTYLDNQCWAMNQSKGQVTSSIHLEYVNEGIHPVPAPKDWDVGFSRITRALQPCPLAKHPVTGVIGAPHLFYLKHCRHFESEAVGYRWRKRAQSARRNAFDEPQDYKDHHMDEWFYLETANPQAAQAPTPPEDRNPLRLLEEARKKYNPLGEEKPVGSWMSV